MEYMGIVSFYNEVCCVMFKDFLEERGVNDCLIEEKKRISVSSELNPFAKEGSSVPERAPEEDRTLYLTFSNGYPLTGNEIFRFFSQRFGENCVERVYVHWEEERKKIRLSGNTSRRSSSEFKAGLFGKVVFTASFFPAVVLGGKDRVTRNLFDAKNVNPTRISIRLISLP